MSQDDLSFTFPSLPELEATFDRIGAPFEVRREVEKPLLKHAGKVVRPGFLVTNLYFTLPQGRAIGPTGWGKKYLEALIPSGPCLDLAKDRWFKSVGEQL